MSWKQFVGLLVLGAFFGACKTVAVLPTKAPVEKVDLKRLSRQIDKQHPRFTHLRGRIKAVYDDGANQQQVIVSLRMTQNQKIWLSANMLIPIAKVLISPKQVRFYEKFQKTYFEGDIAFINQQFNTDFGYENLQDLFLGIPVVKPQKGKWKQISNPINYVLVPRSRIKNIQPTYFFDPTNFLLKEQRFVLPEGRNVLSFKYPEYQKIAGENLPKRIEISFFDGQQLTQLQLEFSRMQFPKNLNFPFRIPEGYKPVRILP